MYYVLLWKTQCEEKIRIRMPLGFVEECSSSDENIISTKNTLPWQVELKPSRASCLVVVGAIKIKISYQHWYVLLMISLSILKSTFLNISLYVQILTSIFLTLPFLMALSIFLKSSCWYLYLMINFLIVISISENIFFTDIYENNFSILISVSC